MEKNNEKMSKEEKADAFFLIMKNRDGESGIKTPITFDAEHLKITDREQKSYQKQPEKKKLGKV